ncbi:Uncharacterised protein [Mycobacterium tuberculosis]|nr:Uncharacterised protein [Mycobacterium tuberculosis]
MQQIVIAGCGLGDQGFLIAPLITGVLQPLAQRLR